MTKIDVVSYTSKLLLLKFLSVAFCVGQVELAGIMDAVLSAALLAEVHSIYL